LLYFEVLGIEVLGDLLLYFEVLGIEVLGDLLLWFLLYYILSNLIALSAVEIIEDNLASS